MGLVTSVGFRVQPTTMVTRQNPDRHNPDRQNPDRHNPDREKLTVGMQHMGTRAV